MSSTQSSTPEFATAAEFKKALAKEMLAVAKEQAIRHTMVNGIAISLGLPSPVALPDSSSDFEIPEIPEEELLDGKPRSAYKASFLAEHDRKQLWAARKQAYLTLREEEGYRLSRESVIQVCKAVGLPVPVVKTTISVKVKGISSTMQFTVNGKIDDAARKRIIEKFTPQVIDPMGDAVRELYPDAEGLTPGVRVDLYPGSTWPQFPDFEEQAEDSTSA